MIVENEILNAIKFFAVQKDINKGRDFDLLANGGRWAMDYTALRHLQYILTCRTSHYIKNVLEFGCGVSTRLLYSIAEEELFFEITTYEHDSEWVMYNRLEELPNNLYKYGGDDLRIRPLQEITYKGQKTLSYENNCTELLNEGKKFELIVIDAPFGQPNYSRPQILFLLPDIINKDNFIIFMDDTERQGEKQTISEICRILNENGIKYQIESYRGEKEHTIICDINKKYLLSSL